jgi:hypothetical protein
VVLLGLLLSVCANAQTVLPFVRIIDFVAAPVGSCAVPNAEFLVVASGDANTSDTFTIFANGAQVYQWQGETMAWVPGPNATTYNIAGEPVDLAANTILTARITTYDSANAAGPTFTAGEAVYVSQASWNCSTGEQVGAIFNADVRPKAVSVMSLPWAALLVGVLSMVLLLGLRRRASATHAL